MQKTIIAHTFQLGKIAYTSGRKVNPVSIEIEITENDDMPKKSIDGGIFNSYLTLSICGEISNGKGNMISCGQNLDTIMEFLPGNKLAEKLHALWKRWHLNDLKAGTRAQNDFLENWEKEGNAFTHEEAVKALKAVNLYEDNGYRYGSGWLVEILPNQVLDEIKQLILADKN